MDLENYRDVWLGEKVNEFIGFYNREFFCLDNFSSFSVDYNGKVYPTVEHAYQSAKFAKGHPEIAEEIRNSFSAYEAKKIASRNIGEIDLTFKSEKLSIMEKLLSLKLAQNPYVREKLLQTKNYLICEDSPKDAFGGIGPNRDGENNLGKLWMKISNELIQGNCE